MPYTNRRTLLPAVFISLLLHGALLLSVVRPAPLLLEVPGMTLQLVVRDTRPAPPDTAPNKPDRPTSEARKPTAPVVPAARGAAERAEPPKVPPKVPPKKEVAVVSTPAAPLRLPRPSATPARKPDPKPAEVAAPPVTSPAVPIAPLADSPVAPADTPSVADAGPTVAAAPPAASPSIASGAGPASVTVERRSSPPEPNQGTVSADALRPFRIALASAARRYKRYPALARERGWEGVAEVSIAIHKSLSPPTVKLVTSSGHALLDDQAVEMMRQAVSATTLPEALRDADFSVRMPVIFRLDEE